MAKNSWLDDNQSTAEGFLRAITKAVKYVNENTPETVAPYLVSYFDGTSEASLAASVKRYRDIDAWRTNLTMTEESFNRLQDIIDEAGELDKRAQMNELVNNTYANKVYGEIYAE